MSITKTSEQLMMWYQEWSVIGAIYPGWGLCGAVRPWRKYLNLLTPTDRERDVLYYNGFCPTYWGSGLPNGADGEAVLFTPLRQTILLFMIELAKDDGD